jgi:hypothetical protein
MLNKTANFINVTVIYKHFNSLRTFVFNSNEFTLISEIVHVGFSPITIFSCISGEKIPSLYLSLYLGGGADSIWEITLTERVQRLAASWTTKESGSDSRQEQEMFLFCIKPDRANT